MISWPARLAAAAVAGTLGGATYIWWNQQTPQTPIEIFRGITYASERLEPSNEGSGFLYWVRVALNEPGIEVYVTPLDPSAVEKGWEYRLQRISEVVRREHLAVSVNGDLFESKSILLRLSGDLAKTVHTSIGDHVVNHSWGRTYLLWFEDRLTPHLDDIEHMSSAELAQAKWAIGGQTAWLSDGQVSPYSDRTLDSRTAVAIDPERKLLFLAVGESISSRLILERFARLGAKAGMVLDGGTSSAIAIGQGARGVRPGVLHGGWRPSASFFGVRASPLLAK